MAVQARALENNQGERIELGMPGGDDGDDQPRVPKPSRVPDAVAGRVSVIEVDTAVPVWCWDVPGLDERE